MAGTLLVAVLVLAGCVIVLLMDAHGKARAYGHGVDHPGGRRSRDAITNVELPPPHFNKRDPGNEVR
jgi:hypothetical protein